MNGGQREKLRHNCLIISIKLPLLLFLYHNLSMYLSFSIFKFLRLAIVGIIWKLFPHSQERTREHKVVRIIHFFQRPLKLQIDHLLNNFLQDRKVWRHVGNYLIPLDPAIDSSGRGKQPIPLEVTKPPPHSRRNSPPFGHNHT